MAFINVGKIVIATTYASNPAIIVEQYAIPVVIPNNFPAPDVKSATPAVTKPKIINGITNCKNEANKPLIVTKTSITTFGAKLPIIIPSIIAIINFGTSPIFFFTFIKIIPPPYENFLR